MGRGLRSAGRFASGACSWISSDIRDAEAWDEAAIVARTDRLSHLAVSTWGHPGGSDVVGETRVSTLAANPATSSPNEGVPFSVADVPSISDGSVTENGGIPAAVRDVIHFRSSPAAERLALRFVHDAQRIGGVHVQAQQSKGDPWYFQVRHEGVADMSWPTYTPSSPGMKTTHRAPVRPHHVWRSQVQGRLVADIPPCFLARRAIWPQRCGCCGTPSESRPRARDVARRRACVLGCGDLGSRASRLLRPYSAPRCARRARSPRGVLYHWMARTSSEPSTRNRAALSRAQRSRTRSGESTALGATSRTSPAAR